jgi:hypothetical protein
MRPPASFQYRGNVFERAKTVSFAGGALRIRDSNGRERTLPFAQIAKIDILQQRSRAYGTAFVCRLWRANALFPALTLGSKSYRGFNDFEPKDSSYRAFVMQLHAAVSKANPAARFEVTVPESVLLHALLTRAHWAIPVIFVVFLATVLVSGDPNAAVVATIAALLGVAWFALSRLDTLGPWRYDPAAIPDGMLPREGGEVFFE